MASAAIAARDGRILRGPNLDGNVRERSESRKFRPVIIRAPRFVRIYTHDGSQVAGSQTPEMKIGDAISIPLDGLLQVISHPAIRIHVEQDRAGVADEAIRPAGDYARPDDTREGVHPKPPERAGKKQADDDQNGYRSIRHHVNYGGAHVVVTMRLSVCVLVLLEDHGMFLIGDP